MRLEDAEVADEYGEPFMPREVDEADHVREPDPLKVATIKFATVEEARAFCEHMKRHDAEVAAKALEDAAEEYTNHVGGTKARPVARGFLRDRAARIRREAGAS